MNLAHNVITNYLSKILCEAISKSFGEGKVSKSEIYGSISVAPNLQMGHFAFPCFPLAKILRDAPPKIAQKIKENILAGDEVEEVLLQGPYINFKISNKFYNDEVLEKIKTEDFFKKDFVKDAPKTMFEYSQPNTHKVLHVGHMRNLCLGNAVIEMGRYLGHPIISVTYPGDVGTHVAKCLWYLKYHNKEDLPTSNKGAWLGPIYTKATHKLEDELGTDKEDQNRAQLTEILKQLHEGEGEYFDLWRETREWSIDLMKEAYAWADVEFDHWFFESTVDSASISYAKELLSKGHLIEDDGAVGMDLSEDKLGFCMLIKSDGTGLYATKDVELARLKFEDFKIEKNIYIVDSRQSHHFKQVFKVLEKVGFEKAKDCYHLPYDVVELPDGAMSSRKGNIVPLMDLIEQMEESIIDNYLSKYRGDWSDEQINETAKKIANGAIKYGMIRIDNNRKIVFDMKEWLKLDGETGPYLQYVSARISSLCEKLNFDKNKSVDYSLLKEKQEISLLLKLSLFNDIVQSSYDNYKTSSLTNYLYELGKVFNSFYAECSISKAESEQLKEARLLLSYCTGEVIRKGLKLLGIDSPLRM